MSGPVIAKEDELVFYNFPPSYWSMKVRIALLEKGVTFTDRSVDLFSRENLQPWYMRLNPKGQLPILQHGEKFILDTAKIIQYLDETYKTVLLQPDKTKDLGRSVAQFTTRLDSINGVLLTLGAFTYKDVTEDMLVPYAVRRTYKAHPRKSVDELKKLAEAHPDLKEVYLTKLQEPSKMVTDLKERKVFLTEVEHCRNVLQDIEKQLEDIKKAFPDKTSWLCGESFTVADVCLANLLRRLQMIGLSKPLFEGGKLPLLEDYYHRVKERPSVKEAFGVKFSLKYLIPDFVCPIVASVGVAGMAIGLGVFMVKKFK